MLLPRVQGSLVSQTRPCFPGPAILQFLQHGLFMTVALVSSAWTSHDCCTYHIRIFRQVANLIPWSSKAENPACFTRRMLVTTHLNLCSLEVHKHHIILTKLLGCIATLQWQSHITCEQPQMLTIQTAKECISDPCRKFCRRLFDNTWFHQSDTPL